MFKTRANNEENIRHRQDGLYEVRVTLGTDFMTGRPKRVSRYAPSREEVIIRKYRVGSRGHDIFRNISLRIETELHVPPINK